MQNAFRMLEVFATAYGPHRESARPLRHDGRPAALRLRGGRARSGGTLDGTQRHRQYGALLARPDQHVAWCASATVTEADGLARALSRIMERC